MHKLPSIGTLFDWFVRLIPAAAFFSLFFAFEDNMRWLGLLGIIPLFMATQKGCPSCSIRDRSCGNDTGFTFGPGH